MIDVVQMGNVHHLFTLLCFHCCVHFCFHCDGLALLSTTITRHIGGVIITNSYTLTFTDFISMLININGVAQGGGGSEWGFQLL